VEKKSKTTFYITTPIYYVNDVPHIGHAYTTIIADAISRFKKLSGYDVFFLTGTDEHGQKVEKAAKEKGLKPKELADKMVVRFKDLWKALNISYDSFIRTTQSFHEQSVQKIFKKLKEKGDIYQGIYKGWYCVTNEHFLAEDVPIEKGRYKICPECGTKAGIISEECYFFKLSAYEKPLLDFYAKNPTFVRPPSRMNEVVSFVKQGLKDLSITRTSVEWGIPVPDDASHTIYVWFDALHNYLTGTGYDWDMSHFQKFWPANIHLIGKDILRFHAIFWPAFLMAAGFALPQTVFGHGWWLKDKAKMSKSKGNVLDPHIILETFGADPLRYVQRTLTMIHNYFGGKIEEMDKEDKADKKLREEFDNSRKKILEFYEDYALNRALEEIWSFINIVNKYLADNEPWKVAKDDSQKKRLGRILYQSAAALRMISYFLFPVIPESSKKIWDLLGEERPIEDEPLSGLKFEDLKLGQVIKKPKPLFPRVDLKEFLKEEDARQAPQKKEDKMDMITFDEFKKMDLRVGEILKAERVEGTDKLLKMEVDIGTEKRTMVAGVADVYSPEELEGKKLIVIVNLQPAVIRGIESQGMLLAAEVEGKATIPFFEKDILTGAKVR
jgi:methionyl-tRNA synthetase